MGELLTNTIDFALCDSQSNEEIRELLMPQLTECGAAYLTGHGIDLSVVEQCFTACNSIHALPISEKDKIDIARSQGARGYFYAGNIPKPSKAQAQNDGDLIQARSYASFEVGNHKTICSCTEERILYADNQWPDDAQSRRYVEDYISHMLGLSRRMEALLTRLLELPIDFFSHKTRCPFYQLRLIDYPPTANQSNFSLGPHTDYECFTFLVQSRLGLEVMTRSGKWLQVPPRKGEIVLLIGDLTEVIAGRTLESVLHKVWVGPERRQSLVFFMGLDADSDLSSPQSEGKGIDLKLRVADHLLARTLENFPHLRIKVENGEIVAPRSFGYGNPFKDYKLERQQSI